MSLSDITCGGYIDMIEFLQMMQPPECRLPDLHACERNSLNKFLASVLEEFRDDMVDDDLTLQVAGGVRTTTPLWR